MFRKAAAAVAVVLFLTAMLTGCAEEPFRLHIIANSDSKEDQSVKLKVRDEILKLADADMKKVKSKEEAEEYIQNNLEIIEQEANKTLEENDMPYTAKAVTGRFEFPEKTYGDKTYPAGQYDALRIILGEGKGKNWWCVMFPPLCLMELDEAQKADEVQKTDTKKAEDTNDPQNVEFKSFFGELFSGIFGGS
jgi:stage II sporulation protein R